MRNPTQKTTPLPPNMEALQDAKGFIRHLRRRLTALVPQYGPSGAVSALCLETEMLSMAEEGSP